MGHSHQVDLLVWRLLARPRRLLNRTRNVAPSRDTVLKLKLVFRSCLRSDLKRSPKTRAPIYPVQQELLLAVRCFRLTLQFITYRAGLSVLSGEARFKCSLRWDISLQQIRLRSDGRGTDRHRQHQFALLLPPPPPGVPSPPPPTHLSSSLPERERESKLVFYAQSTSAVISGRQRERENSELYYSRIEILGSSLFLQSVFAKLHRQHV